MVQLCPGKEDNIRSCGQTRTFGFDELGKISCGCADKEDATSITVVGPVWTCPLHDASSITEMLNLAVEWRWAYTSENGIHHGGIVGQEVVKACSGKFHPLYQIRICCLLS